MSHPGRVIGEIGSGSSFRGLAHYVLHGNRQDPKAPAWVELRNLVASDPERVWVEMEATASQNGRVEKPVLHVVLSPAPGDSLGREEWRRLAGRVLEEMGLGEHQALVALHTDTEHPHLHLAVNRVHPQTLRAWDGWRSKTRLEGVLRRVEREWGLRVVPGRLARGERDGSRWREAPLSRGEQAQLHHRATEPQVLAWRRELRGAFEGARSWSDLAVRLQVHGVHLRARGRGLVVTDGEVYAKASSIGREFSRGRLEARFGQRFSEWRAERDRFSAAAETYLQYAHRGPGHPRARAAFRVLGTAGRSLGWRAAARLTGPWAPAVGAVALGPARAGRGARADWESLLAERVAPALRRSGSWAEAEGRLRFYGVWLATEGSGRGGGRGELVVTDGVRSTRVRELGDGLGPEGLRGRFGASWAEWWETRRELLGRARRLGRFEATVGRRAERWRRVSRLIRESELRVERHRALRAELQATEGRLRGLLRPHLSRRAGEADVRRVLRELRGVSGKEVMERLRGGRSGLLVQGGRKGPVPEELRRVVRDYRELAREVVRGAPAARSAARRLPQLRRRARLLNPVAARRRIEEGLLRTAGRVGGIGMRSLLARAAPGFSSAMALVRLMRRIGREVERER